MLLRLSNLHLIAYFWHSACLTLCPLADRGTSRVRQRLNKESTVHMKSFRTLLALAVAANLFCPTAILAADTAAPGAATVVPQDRNKGDLMRDLRGVPNNVKTLIVTFDQNRDKYLQQQRLLLIKLHNASTPEERDQVRQLLQANRQEFLSDLKGFREELRTDLQALKGKISHGEFGRIIDAAHDAATDGGHRHRGQ
jgi:hypothetical protein